MKLNSHNEWDKLKEVIVGTAKNTSAVLTWKKNNLPDEKILNQARKISKKAFPDWYMDEVEEDLNKLALTLKNFGAKVYRPEVFKFDEFLSKLNEHL